MLASPRSLSFDHDKPFRYVGGDPSIDLVNTAEWTNRGLEKDRLSGYDRLTHWAEGARVITPADAKRLRAVAAEPPVRAGRPTRPPAACAHYSSVCLPQWHEARRWDPNSPSSTPCLPTRSCGPS